MASGVDIYIYIYTYLYVNIQNLYIYVMHGDTHMNIINNYEYRICILCICWGYHVAMSLNKTVSCVEVSVSWEQIPDNLKVELLHQDVCI